MSMSMYNPVPKQRVHSLDPKLLRLHSFLPVLGRRHGTGAPAWRSRNSIWGSFSCLVVPALLFHGAPAASILISDGLSLRGSGLSSSAFRDSPTVHSAALLSQVVVFLAYELHSCASFASTKSKLVNS